MFEEDYILAVKSSIKEATVFLKRSPREIRINSHKRHLLLATEANANIHYITSIYSCARYVASYITKGQRGISELMGAACEVKTGNPGICDHLRTNFLQL